MDRYGARSMMNFRVCKISLGLVSLCFLSIGCTTKSLQPFQPSQDVSRNSPSQQIDLTPPQITTAPLLLNLKEQPTEHPDRIIQSKKVQGRFIKSLWGDYLYSFVGTKSGEIMFMINSDESCFLRQHRRSELSINYDVVDRYIPQASSYGHYNIIRNVQSKTTNLATWLKSVTTKELDQCAKQDQADTAREK
jgi:hypothetical protein